MCDAQERLGVENMFDLVRKKIHGIFGTKYPTKDQIRKYKRPGKNGLLMILILTFIVILFLKS